MPAHGARADSICVHVCKSGRCCGRDQPRHERDTLADIRLDTHPTHLAAVVCFSVVMQWICLPAGMCKEPKCFPVTDLIGAYCPLRQVPQSEIL